jgi:hypothetical protein
LGSDFVNSITHKEKEIQLKFERKMRVFKRISRFYYKITDGIRMIFKWMPTIFYVRPWDSCFIYLLLDKQLEMMERELRKNIHVGDLKQAKQVQICKNHCKRLYDEDYFKFIDPDDKWLTEKYNVRKYFEQEKYLKEQDKEMLFGIMRKHIDGWWT